MTTKPTDKLRKIIANTFDGSVSRAATAWGVEYRSLYRFMDEAGGLTLATAMQIRDRIDENMPMESLFEHVEEKEKR